MYVIILLTKMAINNNSKKAYTTKTCHTATEHKNSVPLVTSIYYKWRSTKGSHYNVLKNFDKKKLKGLKESGHDLLHLSIPKPESGPNLTMTSIELLCIIENAL